MIFRILVLLLFPAFAYANPEICDEIDPNKNPLKTIEICTELLTTPTLSTLERAEALENRGIAYRESGELEKSIEDLGASVALSNDTAAMRMLAWTYRTAGRFEDAENLYSRILAEDKHEQGWLSRCVVRQDLRKYEEALTDCNEALRLNSENLDTLFFTAHVLSILERPTAALPLTKRAMMLAPNDVRHLVENVWSLHQLGRTFEARKKAKRGLVRFPDDSDLVLFLDQTK